MPWNKKYVWLNIYYSNFLIYFCENNKDENPKSDLFLFFNYFQIIHIVLEEAVALGSINIIWPKN